ncbi:hypothetical protein D6827_00395, partial [Candidatus Parcubacteria bacterium]
MVYLFNKKRFGGGVSAVLFTLILALVWFVMPGKQAFAVQGDSSNINLVDSNGNGKIDKIQFQIDNSSLGTWALTGSSPYGFSVTQAGSDITISGVVIANASSNPALVQITLDESDPDLVMDTDAVSSSYPIELIYTQTGLTGSYVSDGTTELNAIATGDTGPTDTENDTAAPVIKNVFYKDADADGKIDRIGVTFTEDVANTSALYPNNFSITAGDFTGLSDSTDGTTNLLGSGLTYGTTANVDLTEASVVDTYDDSGTFAISLTGTFNIDDSLGNSNTSTGAQSQANIRDAAKPVIKSSSPSDGATGVIRTGSVTWYFSESMDTGGGWVSGSEFSVSPSNATWNSATWSTTTVSNDTVTVSHTPLACGVTYTITTDDTQINATNGTTGYTALNDASTAPIGTSLTFRTINCESSSSSDDEKVSYSLSVDSPESAITAGDDYEITWEASSNDYYVDIYYLDENGDYQLIASAENNDGSYTWSVPSDLSLFETQIYIDWNDLASSVATATSDTFAINNSTEDTVSTEEETETPSTETKAVNPFTGEEEEITEVSVGDFITSPETDTVYYID